MLKRLEQKELVSVDVNPETHRQELISLTPKAKELLENLLPEAAAVSEELVEPLDSEERDKIVTILQKLAGIRN